MDAPNRKPLTAHYMLTGIVLAALLFYSYRLHQYSKYSKQLVATIQSLQISTGSSTAPLYDSNFKANIEKQLAISSSGGTQWALALKKDSTAYPQNIAAHSFLNMQKFGVVLENMKLNNDTVLCRLLVRDKQPFYVTVKFIQKGNIYLLDNLDNVGALYTRLNCHDEY